MLARAYTAAVTPARIAELVGTRATAPFATIWSDNRSSNSPTAVDPGVLMQFRNRGQCRRKLVGVGQPLLPLLVAEQVSQDLAMALFKEALKAGWFNGAR
jgi:hypothetical protein